MPRRKKLPDLGQNPDLTGLGRADKDPLNWEIQKSNPLRSLSQTDLTLTHFKILDAYLSRINSHKPEERYVQFHKGELEQLLGVSKINKEDLNTRLDGLFCAVTIQDNDKPNKFVKIGLFAKAECKRDEDGLWQVRLACTQEAMEYIFNIENLGYIRYRLRNIINLKSRYSYILFLLLTEIRNSNRPNTFSIPVDTLKELLNCTADSYSEFKLFNDRILKKCHAEINAKTDIKYTYTPDKPKHGRKITSVTFSIFKAYDELSPVDPNQIIEVDLEDSEEADNSLLSEACKGAFTEKEMDVIFQIICTASLPRRTESYELDRYHYLAQMYSELCYREDKAKSDGKPIKNRFLYFKKMIEKDLQV